MEFNCPRILNLIYEYINEYDERVEISIRSCSLMQPVPFNGFGQKSCERLFNLGIMSTSFLLALRDHERDAHLTGCALAVDCRIIKIGLPSWARTTLEGQRTHPPPNPLLSRDNRIQNDYSSKLFSNLP